MKSVYEPSRSLMDFHIAGFTYHEGLSVIDKLTLGTKVDLRHEPENPYDPNAVAIYYGDVKVGYIPREKNSEIFAFLYFGHGDLFEARISMVNKEAHPEQQFRVSVKIKDSRNQE